MKHFVLMVSLLAFCLALCSTFAVGQTPNTSVSSLILYDDFNGPRIDPAKWIDGSTPQGDREMVRQLSPPYQGQGNNGRLHMLEQSYSMTANDSDESYGWVSLAFTNPAPIKEVSFTVAVNSATATQCQSNPDNESSTWAGFTGLFFNYFRGQDPTYDVGASLQLNRNKWNPTGPLVVAAVVSTGGPLNFWNYQELGTVKPGQTAKLRVRWDQPNKQFVFQLNSNSPVPIAYNNNIDDSSDPYYQFKALTIGHGVPNCTTQPSGSTMMDAYLDNVYIGMQ